MEDTPQHLTVLLFILEAWGIAAAADVPRLPVPDTGASRLPEVPGRNDWDARWHRAWERAWDWYSVQEPDPTVPPTRGYIPCEQARASRIPPAFRRARLRPVS